MTEERLIPGTEASSDSSATRANTKASTDEPPRLRRPDRAQAVLEPVCLDERLPADHPARTVWQVVEQLDLLVFQAQIAARGSEPGRAATDPRLLVALWCYVDQGVLPEGAELKPVA